MGGWTSRLVLTAMLVSAVGVTPGAGPLAERPAGATPLGSLPTEDPTLAYDPASSGWVSLASGQPLAGADQACDPSDGVWAKGYANVPYRVGPRPDRLGVCWSGDALPDGPGAWAADVQGSVGSPALAFIDGVWWLFYTARRTMSSQRCIGTAASNSPTGPSWFLGEEPAVCPTDGSSASDPELYYDRATGSWYLLWRELDPAGCSSTIMAEKLPAAGQQTTGPHQLVSATSPAMGFDDLPPNAACPGGRHLVGNPTAARAGDGFLWLLFSGNDADSVNHATSWAICGGPGEDLTSGDAATDRCVLASALDPEGYHRPVWGWSGRTDDTGSPAPPYFGFPDAEGFGAISLAMKDPTSTGPQPVYATGQAYEGGVSNLHVQHVLRFDAGHGAPALFEPETVVFHGRAGTFGSLAPPAGQPPPTAYSGQSLATRPVGGFGWPPGVDGMFADVAADGTVFVAGLDQNHTVFTSTADEAVLGLYDPRTSEWRNLNLTTTNGSTAVSPFVCGSTTVDPMQCDPDYSGREPGDPVPAGGLVADVQPIDGGAAMAFTITYGHPTAYWDNPAPPQGVWPTLGIVSQVNGEWRVASGSGWVNQWTGGQLAQTEDPSIPPDERACPPSPRVPAGESNCGGPNEMALLPASGELIIAQYLGNETPLASTGLMAVDVSDALPDGRRTVDVTGNYRFPTVPDPTTSDPGDQLVLLAKEVQVDPTGTFGDERFSVAFDIARDDDGVLLDLEDPPLYTGPNVVMVFSYDATTGDITPVTAPLITGLRDTAGALGGLGTARFDDGGNLWTDGVDLVVYAKERLARPGCAFDGDLADEVVHDAPTATVPTGDVFGRHCPPDYVIEQARTRNGLFANHQLSEDPNSSTMVVWDAWGAGVVPIRYAGSGRTMTFTIGNVVDTGKGGLGTTTERLYGNFDGSGRAFFVERRFVSPRPCLDPPDLPPLDPLNPRCPGVEPYQDTTHWITSVDLPQLFDPAPVTLSTTPGSPVRVQAEHNLTFATTQTTPPTPDDPIVVTSVAQVWGCTDIQDFSCLDNGAYELAHDATQGHTSGDVTYNVHAPAAGTYRVAFRINGGAGAQIGLSTGTQSLVMSADTGHAWSTETMSQTVSLPAGVNTLTLSPTAGSWRLQWFTLEPV